jgi:hypothetical protein
VRYVERLWRALGTAIAFSVSACSSSDSGTLQLVTGEEDASATFAGVTTLTVKWVDSNAVAHDLTRVSWPAASIDLGSLDESTVGMIEVYGTSATGQNLVFGSLVPLPFGSLAGMSVPVFVQRVGSFARLPDASDDERTAPLLGVLGARYLVIAGGSESSNSTQLYDLLELEQLPSPPALPIAPESMALAGTVAYLVNATSAATYDLSDGEGGTWQLPPAIPTPALIAGGTTVTATDGTQYVIGGTRTTAGPTTAGLRIDTAGNVTPFSLTVPRQGAAAAWIDQLSGLDGAATSVSALVVIGGSTSSPGAELVEYDAGTISVVPLAFAADPSSGAGAATLDDRRYVILAGGVMPDLSDPGVRVLDLDCTADCSPTPWPALPQAPLAGAQTFQMPITQPDAGLAGMGALVVGSDLDAGLTHAFLVTSTSAVEVATRVQHTHARAVASPIGITPGSFFLFGGAPEIESFVPAF